MLQQPLLQLQHPIINMNDRTNINFNTTPTIEELTEKVNQLVFPQAVEGDNVTYEGVRFLYINGTWVPQT